MTVRIPHIERNNWRQHREVRHEIKVLQVILTVSPRFGGPANVCMEMSRELSRLGAQVTIFTTNLDYPSCIWQFQRDEKYEAEIKIHYFPVQFRPMAVSLQMGAMLWREIRKYDIVHIHGLYRFPLAFAAWCARRKGVPYIIRTCGTLDPYLFHHPRHRRMKRFYERFFALPNLQGASAIHFTTKEEQKLVHFLNFHSPGVVIPNGLNWKVFQKLLPAGKFRRRIGLTDEQIILYLGRIHFKKGLDLLVKGFEKVARHLPNSRLVIGGPDNDGYEKEVRKWVAEANLTERVYFPGMLEGREVMEAYVDADVFALPSYSENFGIAVAEAMACACPVVISDKVNIWREVKKANAGIVVPCEEQALGAALLNLLQDPHRRRAMGLAGRELVRETYNWEKIGLQVMDLYRKLTQSSTRV